MLENITKELIEKSREDIIKRYDEYLKDKYDSIDIIEIYLKIKFRDSLSFGAGNNSMRTQLYKCFRKACIYVNVDIDDTLRYYSKLHNRYKNDENHFEILDKEINKWINELRQWKYNSDHFFDDDNLPDEEYFNNYDIPKEDLSLLDRFTYELNSNNILYKWNNVPTKLSSLVTEWTSDGKPKKCIPCTIINMITDKVGDRHNNIGCYYGQTCDGKYILVPQGIKYLNKLTNSHVKNIPEIYNTLDELISRVISLIEYFYSIKYNLKED